MKNLFTIGQLSKLFNVKISALRYYDEIGLLKPAEINVQTNYRYYSTQQFERLNVINYLRALDLSVESIKQFFEARDIDKLEEMLKSQKVQIKEQILILKNIERRIDTRIKQVDDAVNSVVDKIEIVDVPEMAVIYLDEDYRPNDDIEFPIATLRQKFGVDKNIFLGKVALTISQNNLLNNRFDSYNGLLLIMEPGDDWAATDTLNAGKYVRLRFHGTHDTAFEEYPIMIDYCQKHNFQINGPAVETALIDYGISDDVEKYITEIRIPIEDD
ncbi:MerR family transcriptional regulator [Companilactobacillus nantensis]|uniref:Transcription regulator of multidrug-efflux transporter n=1 Tax=Companilactobacillus nantensis DSM 16982 TaxID=1423774 RepID=A0A0R1WEC4_9LACO|nr:MerR family transcriptional regulator [Companilactobacillus nantensis]KRM16410.1 transcription regulator of multidrug-efflux transporter [Companilactobacillus nantensis DSM 16982]GEO64156.1 MerR family transcriptional regulator [Companilactobacillus nantensis]